MPLSRRQSIQRRLLTAVLAVVAYPGWTLAICLLLLAASAAVALMRLEINTDEDQLFSLDVPFFKNFLEYENQFPENEALYVLIEPADRKNPPPLGRWTDLADRLASRVRGLSGIVQSVQGRIPIAALGDYALLFQDRPALEEEFAQARDDLVPLARIWTEGDRSHMRRFLYGLSLQKPDADQASFVKLLADSWTRTARDGRPTVPDLTTLAASDPGDLGYDYAADETDPSNHLLLIQVYLADEDGSMTSGARQVEAVRAAARDAAGGFDDFHVAVTGRPVLDADEMRTSDTDSTRAEIVALAAVFAGLLFFLRSLWLAVAAEIALVVAIGWTFGWATLAVGELNLLSLFFLITLIGIGMDYLVQILTRYRREARLYERPAAVWARVFRHVSPPICTACLGAAGAFFVSIFTGFRGSRELGIIAGGGLLLCLLSGYTLLPALLTVFKPNLGRLGPEHRYATAPVRSAARRLLPAALWVGAMMMVLPFSRRTYFNPNLLDMQAKNLESVQLVRKLQTWSAVVMSKDLSMLAKARDAIQPAPTVARVESILQARENDDWLRTHPLPPIAWASAVPMTEGDIKPIANAAGALAAHLELWGFSDAAASLRRFNQVLNSSDLAALSQWQSQFVGQLRTMLARFSPPPLNVAALPDELRNHLVSSDGTYALYVYPKENLWRRPPLEHFVLDVESRLAAVPDHPPLTGIAPHIYHSTQFVATAFYRATAYALVVVIVLVFLDLRSITHTLLTVSVLGLGLPMLVGLMGLIGLNWNFANFFALPILIGAGHEYGVFMMHRYREAVSHPRRVWTSWDSSDRALLLCAYVTTSSFAFFWALGHHEGLKSLGLVMAMGTGCTYLAAVLVVRPVLKWRIERAGHCGDKSGTRKVPAGQPNTASAAR